jgi:hypothetical protein
MWNFQQSMQIFVCKDAYICMCMQSCIHLYVYAKMQRCVCKVNYNCNPFIVPATDLNMILRLGFANTAPDENCRKGFLKAGKAKKLKVFQKSFSIFSSFFRNLTSSQLWCYSNDAPRSTTAANWSRSHKTFLAVAHVLRQEKLDCLSPESFFGLV